MQIVFPFISPVNGISFHIDNAKHAHKGDTLQIKQDIDNIYDAKAMMIIHQENKIGFLPKELAHRLVDSHITELQAEVDSVLETVNGFGLRVKILGPLNYQLTPESDTLPIANRQGRFLGNYISHTASSVLIRHGSGRAITYPIALTDFSPNSLLSKLDS